MRHKKRTAKLGRTRSHRQAMISNMITSLFRHERVKTTVQKAKEVRRFAEKAITLAKKNTLHSRRLALEQIEDEDVVNKLFSVIGPRFSGRNGGYTRIIRLGHRGGDGAEMAFLELVDRIPPPPGKEERKRKRRKAEEEEPAVEKGAVEPEEAKKDEVTEGAAEEAEAESRPERDEVTTEEASVEGVEIAEKVPPKAKKGRAEKTKEKKKKGTKEKK